MERVAHIRALTDHRCTDERNACVCRTHGTSVKGGILNLKTFEVVAKAETQTFELLVTDLDARTPLPCAHAPLRPPCNACAAVPLSRCAPALSCPCALCTAVLLLMFPVMRVR